MCAAFFPFCAGPILGALGVLTRLKTLFLSHNQLTGEPVALFSFLFFHRGVENIPWRSIVVCGSLEPNSAIKLWNREARPAC